MSHRKLIKHHQEGSRSCSSLCYCISPATEPGSCPGCQGCPVPDGKLWSPLRVLMDVHAQVLNAMRKGWHWGHGWEGSVACSGFIPGLHWVQASVHACAQACTRTVTAHRAPPARTGCPSSALCCQHHCAKCCLLFGFLLFVCFRFYLFIFLARRGREGEMERNIDQLPLASPQLRTWPTTQACVWTGNWIIDPSVCGTTPNQLSHTSQTTTFYLLILYIN